MDVHDAKEIDKKLRSLITATDVFNNITLSRQCAMISSVENFALEKIDVSNEFFSSITLSRNESSLIETMPDDVVVSLIVNGIFMEAMKLSTRLKLNSYLRFSESSVSIYFEKLEYSTYFIAHIDANSFDVYQFKSDSDIVVRIGPGCFQTNRTRTTIRLNICKEDQSYSMHTLVGQTKIRITASFNESKEPKDYAGEDLLVSAIAQSGDVMYAVSNGSDNTKLILQKTIDEFILHKTGGNSVEIKVMPTDKTCKTFDTTQQLLRELNSNQMANIQKFVQNQQNSKIVLLELREFTFALTKLFKEESFFKIWATHSQSNSKVLPGELNEDLSEIISNIDDEFLI